MSAKVSITLTGGPLGPAERGTHPEAGAWLTFDGVVRPLEEGRQLAALNYEAYEPMTGRELRRLAEQIADKHSLLAIRVEHSVGRVAVGETSFRLTIASKHRAEGIAATDEFIREMKRYVPLWKNNEW